MTGDTAAPPTTRAALLERIRAERAALEETIRPFDEATMTEPGPEGWSVKDHLAHLATWQRILLVARLEGRSFAEAAGMDDETSKATEHMTAEGGLNDWFFERDRDLPLPQVLAALHETHEELLDALETHDEAALLVEPLLDHVTGNTYEHDHEHRAIIEALASRS